MVRGLADDYKHGNAAAQYCIAFVVLISDPLVMREYDPPFLTDLPKPYIIWRVRRKVVVVPLDNYACTPENGGELLA